MWHGLSVSYFCLGASGSGLGHPSVEVYIRRGTSIGSSFFICGGVFSFTMTKFRHALL